LMQKVWPDTVVEENNLSQNISALRRVLGENRGDHQFIITVPGRGYKFVADVNERWEESSGPLSSDKLIEPEPPVNLDGQITSATQALSQNGFKPAIAQPASPVRLRHSRQVLYAFFAFVGLGIILFYFSFASRSKSVAASVPVRSIAVLPFKQLSNEGGDEYLGVSLADALITKLSNIREIAVRPTDTVLKYNGQNVDPSRTGHELGVDTVLEGNLQHSGDRIRVTVQLISVNDGVPLWADKYDEKFTNIFDVQDTISERVAGKLALKLSAQEQQLLTKRFTESPEAYQAYLKGRYYWNKRTSAALEEGLRYFQQAKDIDPSYALAYAGIADTYVLLGHRYDSVEDQRDAYPKAKSAAIRALQLNDMLAEAHTSLAVVKQRYDLDW